MKEMPQKYRKTNNDNLTSGNLEMPIDCVDMELNPNNNGTGPMDEVDGANGGKQKASGKDETSSHQKGRENDAILYAVNERPAWYMCFLLGFQHYIVMFGANIGNILVLSSALCIGESDVTAIPEIIGTTFFCCGIVTFIQSMFGVRLPIVQGGSFTYIIPVKAILESDQWACNINAPQNNATFGVENQSWNTTQGIGSVGFEPKPWQARMLEIQGAIMIGSLVEMAIGFSGKDNFILMHFIFVRYFCVYVFAVNFISIDQ